MVTTTQLHHALFYHAEKASQKIALMLDGQMLSFAEVMYCVQKVAVHLLKQAPAIQPNEIVYQMLQRSVELPIAYFAILTAGAAYCALNPMDGTERIKQLIDQIGNNRYMLVKSVTNYPM